MLNVAPTAHKILHLVWSLLCILLKFIQDIVPYVGKTRYMPI
jgi:hypothetical protein